MQPPLCAPSLSLCASWAGGFQPRTECSQVDAAGHCASSISVLPAGMIHGGLIELSNIDIPVKTARVYVVMVPAPLYITLPPDSIPFLCPSPLSILWIFPTLFACINSFPPSVMSLVEILIGFDDSIFVSVSLCSRSYAIIGSICKYSIHGSDTRGNKRIVKRLESNDNLILMNRKNRWTEPPSFLFRACIYSSINEGGILCCEWYL